MSRVFLAEEIALGREVVLKVLPPELGGAVSPERFQREVRVAAGLQHPHIVPLFAAGQSGELLYYTMPFISGESLRAKLDREGALPVADAVRYLRDVVDALAAAHERGVVHRDIKPDNVLLSHHHALVTDFGIAKALAEAGGAGTLTATGLSLGTPSYMAPEQAAGESTLDHRADIYAVGILGYEMLTGEPPFRGPSAQAVIAGHLSRPAPPVTQDRPTVPAALSAIIARCLEKLPADRFASSAELLAQLDAIAITGATTGTVATDTPPRITMRRASLLFGAAAALVLAVVYTIMHLAGLPDWVLLAAAALLALGLPIVLATTHHEARRIEAGVVHRSGESPVQRLLTWRRALAGGALAFTGLALVTALFMTLRVFGVGPFATLLSAGTLSARAPMLVAEFDNRTADSTLGQSVTEALRIDMSRSHAVRLLETSDVAAALRRMERDPAQPLTSAVAREVAERAGARAVITGEIAPLGAGFSLSARLVGATDGATLLAERESAANASGLIAAVDRLSRKLRERIGESLRSIRAGAPLEEVTTSSLEALRKYSDGDRLFDAGELPRARTMLEAAIALDSNFAMAHRKLSVILNNTEGEPARRVAEARKAYDLRNRLPERERLQAVASYFLNLRSGPDSVIPVYRQLLETWPEDKPALNNMVLVLNVAHRYVEAESLAMRAIALYPRTSSMYDNAVEAMIAQNGFARADSLHLKWSVNTPTSPFRIGNAAQVAAARGDFALADRFLDTLMARGIPGALRAARQMRASYRRTQGRLADAEREDLAVMEFSFGARQPILAFEAATDWAYDELAFRGRGESAVRRLDSLVAAHPYEALAPADRPYTRLAEFYARAGKIERAERLLAEYDRAVAPEIRRGDQSRTFAAGLISAARGKHDEAIAELRAGTRFGSCRPCGFYEVGQAFDALQRPDSALAAFETFVTWATTVPTAKQFGLAPALRRLGELYESKGDRQKALTYYGRMVELWKDADPELQPIVQDVRKRIAALGRNPG
jgi:tetratricopeptide (TPR) repeat protein